MLNLFIFVFSYYCHAGTIKSPLPPALRPSQSGTALFVKTPYTASGSVGVFTYDIFEMLNRKFCGRIVVMFSNPFDFNLYHNWYGIGAFNNNKQCNAYLFNEMYYGMQNGFVRGNASGPSLSYEMNKSGPDGYYGPDLTIKAYMSDDCQPLIKVELCDK